MSARRGAIAALLTFATLAGPVLAQDVSGTAYEDRDADGIRDPGEPALPGVTVELLGQVDAAGGVDQSVVTDAAGAFSFSPGAGCYVLLPQDLDGWRMAPSRADRFAEGTAGYQHPAGRMRPGKLDHGLANLRSGALRYTAMGDSIAWNWNSCFYRETFWYSRQLRDRLQCASPGTTFVLDEEAVKGEHTDDLLVDDNADGNNIFRVLELEPDLITISMIGNDLLGVDAGNGPTQEETNRAVAEVLDARQNLQEAISWMVTSLPQSDVTLNTLYDNLAYGCYGGTATTDFHRVWLPIINEMLRDLAWGQARRVSINEAAAEFAQENQNGTCSGFSGQICRDIFQTDNIHPNNAGYEVVLEKVWEGAGGVQLGPKDVLGRTEATDLDPGFLRRVRRLYPTVTEALGGANVIDPAAALTEDDAGATAGIRLGAGDQEFRLSGFPDWYDEIRIVKVVAGVRYRTSGAFTEQLYRIEASPGGQFRPDPGHAYTPTDWNFYTPMVGAGGPNAPAENPDYPDARLLAFPNVAALREVSATLTSNPVLDGPSGEYLWPALTHEDLASTAVRIAAAQVGADAGADPRVELDVAWLDLYGWEEPRPAEVTGLAVERLADGTLEVSFDDVAGAQRYNLYFGRLATLAGGTYDHGAGAPAGPICDAATVDAGPGRRKIVVASGSQPADDAYLVVTAHVDDVESPAGFDSVGEEIDRAQSVCR